MKSNLDDHCEMQSVDAERRVHFDSGEWILAFWAVTAAFGCYFCMYGFRKPFTAARFEDSTVWGLGFKSVLLTSQVAGYMISKFIGIKIIAEMRPERRAVSMLWLILVAEGALVLFGLLPRPWNATCLFLNGLPLGMVFGLVQGYLEGRRLTELLTAGLCSSFILADGATKSVGAWLLSLGIAEDWMPAAAGAIFLLPFGIFLTILSRTPTPSARDIAARHRRQSMGHMERVAFVRRYGAGLIPLVLMYLLVTIVRSLRADFAPEIWRELIGSPPPAVFTTSEMFVALGVLVINGAAVFIADNRRAFLVALATCGLGLGLMLATLLGRSSDLIDGFTFMVLLGLGLYLPYVAVHTTLLERMLAMTRERGNVGFLMYFADTVGYLGYVAVMLVRNSFPVTSGALGLLTMVCWLTIGISTVCLLCSWFFFADPRIESVADLPPENLESPLEAGV